MAKGMGGFHGPLFIVGMPRSGTKLLRGLLNEHPLVGIPAAETEFLPAWARRWPQWGDLEDPSFFADFYAQVTRSPYFTYLREEQGHQVTLDDWYRACRSFDLPGVFEALLRLDGGAPEDGVWGDKSPGYLVHLPLLRQLFPRARAVHIVRDVRDYCLSIHKAWHKSQLRAAQRWADRVGQARRDATEWGPDLLEVRYEDLLADPQPVLERICDLVELPFDPAMLRLSRTAENLGDAAGSREIKADNAAKFRTRMAPRLQRRIERIAGAVLEDCGYPVDRPATPRRLSQPLMLALQLTDGFNLVRCDVERRGWRGALAFRWQMFRESGAWERLA